MKSLLRFATALFLACAMALTGCLASFLDAEDESIPGGKTNRDSIVVKDSISDTIKPPIDSIKPPVDSIKPPIDTLKPPVDTAKPPVDTLRPPVDTISIPIDTLKPPVDTAKPPVDGSRKYPWGYRKYPCESTACPDSATWPGDTLYISARRDAAMVYRAFPITATTRLQELADTLAGFLRDSAVAAGPGTRVEARFSTMLTIDGNSAAITGLCIHNHRFGLMRKPLDIPVGPKMVPADIRFGMDRAMMDCRVLACPDSLMRLGDTLFFSTVKNGIVEGGSMVMKDEAALKGDLENALTRFFRSALGGAGLGTTVDYVGPADSHTLKGSFTVYGNTVAITAFRIRNSRIGDIVGPLDVRAGSTRLSVVYRLPSVYGQPWPTN